ncbi:C45 family autoproteolytic acyltransferase/hydolase [Brevibacterium casei]|uniref:Predicted choloylglycine hydrolase n=1 Tax=Brevibacterium casei CIP 102111 TaxID=1255625 RepID=A0A2H1IVQ6_9MICO|nr:C45 family peptidase [Brevibacterium casei]QPR39612.1 peptidase C45 [Brevibacterium casei]QPR43776.1 peptidase C45 [Brevibacterium casei]SMX79283.1 Predicted choloylglycine hydrolase [Brevibacterium casei CIP 102111]
MTSFTFYGITEDRPSTRWKALFDAVWPGYRAWYLRDGDSARPDLATAEAKLREHMPELVPTWQRLVDLTGGDETAARMLTLWNPPRFLPGCSQVAMRSPEPALLRNYDYGLELFEQVHASTRYGSRRVIGTSDCLWGLLDGLNEDGLAVSLAFGGRPGDGDGFAAPLVVRFLLEVAGDVPEALRRLETVPVSMYYNLTMVDATGRRATAYVGPGMAPEVVEDPVATNHRGRSPEYPDHARRFRSVERQDLLTEALEGGRGVDEMAETMLGPGVFSGDYDNAFGTLYTAVYRPLRGEVEYRWHSRRWTRSLSSEEEMIVVTLDDSTEPVDLTGSNGTPSGASDTSSGTGGTRATPSAGGATGGTQSQDAAVAEVAELVAQAHEAINGLAHSPDPAAFSALISLSSEVGEALGTSARLLAEHNSWARVAELADVSRQAAWQRWR